MAELNFDVILKALPYLWSGLQFSIALTASTFFFGLVLGTALALLQHLQVPVAGQLVRLYVAFLRSTPLILVLFWFYFLIPLALAYVTQQRPTPIGANMTAFITFAIFEAAYYSEIIRTGLRSIGDGQYKASRALGFTTVQTYRFVVLPQVRKVVSPVILSQTIILFQDTSLVYVLSVTDFLGAATKLGQINGTLTEMYLTVAVVYLVICSAASLAVQRMKRRTAGLRAMA